MNEQTYVYGSDQVEIIAQKVCALLSNYRAVVLIGSLGAGKTTLMQAILQQLGVYEPVTSPTFAYVQSYTSSDGIMYHHFDLYRIGSADEFIAAGFDEYLADKQAKSFIEWPESIVSLLEHMPVLQLTLDYEGIEQRRLTIKDMHGSVAKRTH